MRPQCVGNAAPLQPAKIVCVSPGRVRRALILSMCYECAVICCHGSVQPPEPEIAGPVRLADLLLTALAFEAAYQTRTYLPFERVFFFTRGQSAGARIRRWLPGSASGCG